MGKFLSGILLWIALMAMIVSCNAVPSDVVQKSQATRDLKASPSPMATPSLVPTSTPVSILSQDQAENYWPDEPLDRSHYAEIDLEKALQEFAQRGQDNGHGDPYTDATATGLHFAGFPNGDDRAPNRVLTYFKDKGREATVIVILYYAADDSIKDIETRVDLHFENNHWTIVWAGDRFRCKRSGYDGWVTTPCP